MDVLQAIAATPTTGDHVPTNPSRSWRFTSHLRTERAQLRQAEVTTTDDDGTSAARRGLHPRLRSLSRGRIVSASAIASARSGSSPSPWSSLLLTFFVLWVALGGGGNGSGSVGVALFAGAVAMFWLMGRFERPTRRAAQAVSRSHESSPMANCTPRLGSINRRANSRSSEPATRSRWSALTRLTPSTSCDAGRWLRQEPARLPRRRKPGRGWRRSPPRGCTRRRCSSAIRWAMRSPEH